MSLTFLRTDKLSKETKNTYKSKMSGWVKWMSETHPGYVEDGKLKFPLPQNVIMEFLATRTEKRDAHGQVTKHLTASNVGGFISSYKYYYTEELKRPVDQEVEIAMKSIRAGIDYQMC